MTTRMVSRTVVFRRPFVLGGFERVEPAGSYTVETEEECNDNAAIVAWRRLATVMHVTHAGTTEYVKIDSIDLDKALSRDEGPEETSTETQERLDDQRRRNNARLIRRKKF